MTRRRLTDEQERARAAFADSQGIGEQEAAVRVSVGAADRLVQRTEIAELSARGRKQYSALLDRLAQ
ncbi:CopG family transcriptional regulator [Rathayibacter sp. SD072]|nr:CopG family transcriptional regulator [Rathayibacter sp. SD072]